MQGGASPAAAPSTQPSSPKRARHDTQSQPAAALPPPDRTADAVRAWIRSNLSVVSSWGRESGGVTYLGVAVMVNGIFGVDYHYKKKDSVECAAAIVGVLGEPKMEATMKQKSWVVSSAFWAAV